MSTHFSQSNLPVGHSSKKSLLPFAWSSKKFAALAISQDSNLARYLRDIRKFPILSLQEEYSLTKAWVDHGEAESAHKLVTSHLRFVAKIATGYSGYGLPLDEMIAEGNIGMMQAVRRFDPERGFRLATYAMWWIRAAIQEYILHSWSLVKIGTTAAQKKLFFNLRRLKGKLHQLDEGRLKSEGLKSIAEELQVSEKEVASMDERLRQRDFSLNAPVHADGEGEWQDWLIDHSSNQEIMLAESQELQNRQRLLQNSLAQLNERERDIISARRLQDPQITLNTLSRKHGISRERVRQIEVRAFAKLQKLVRGEGPSLRRLTVG